MMSVADLFFSTKGRIGRGKWWAGVITLGVLNTAITLILFKVVGWTEIGRIVYAVWSLAMLYPAYCVLAKRFQDRDERPILAQVAIALAVLRIVLDVIGVTNPFVPNTPGTVLVVMQGILGLAFFVMLGCLRGTVGDNRFGADPVPGVPYGTQPVPTK
jgi:uncharacterized membrane protein YhaH (DUF805 family)